ncbi:unnamed protein product [Albugo candida]|uniref:Uncharacterized protein n=1 Tax=Albugo candida TaxID=65357 RepID=A0A024FVX1_9STRA|nr:unnamed protein product [Albugo candida]|eukprot:CCI11027.1 unnamed protein product [Albugo candida]
MRNRCTPSYLAYSINAQSKRASLLNQQSLENWSIIWDSQKLARKKVVDRYLSVSFSTEFLSFGTTNAAGVGFGARSFLRNTSYYLIHAFPRREDPGPFACVMEKGSSI